jgi:hypothetical protein
MTCESLKRGRQEVKSCFPLFLFQISFFILSNAKVSKSKYVVEKEKNGEFGGERENSNANGGRMVEKKMG